MSKKKRRIKRIDPNLIIAVCVLIVSFSTLFVYVRQAKIMSEQTKILLDQTKANAWPHLSIELYKNYDKKGLIGYSIEVSNKGTGPAILEYTLISYNDVNVTDWMEFYTDWMEFYKVIKVPDSIPLAHNNNNINERVLASNEKLNLINWSVEPNHINNSNLINYIFSKADEIEIEICYKSIHGDSWKVKRKGFKSDLELNERSVVTSCNLGNNKKFME